VRGAGPDNETVAELLGEYADLLAISGGDPFRVRNYTKAARAIAGHPADVCGLDERALQRIPGVGRSIAAKVRAICDHGSFDELDDLRAQVPAGVRALLGVPGLGPKRAKQLHDELGITSVEDLLHALATHRLEELPGFGARLAERLRQGIARRQAAGERIPLGVARRLADELLAVLTDRSPALAAEAAGSLRRWCPTVGDIDLLVATHRPEAVTEVFCTAPPVAEVLARGPTRSSVRTRSGVQVDLRVIEPEVWGAALLYFTGSKAHNVKLRQLAQRHGWKLSEYGLDDVATGRRLAAATEEEVYERLGLAWIPPTLREDRGEIEAAASGRLPRLVTRADLRGDLHAHTDATDGVASLAEMVAAARARGHAYFAVTDHAPLLHMQRFTREKAEAQRAELRALEVADGIRLLHGTELNIAADGSLDWDDAFLATFDLCVASVHSAFTQPPAEMTARLGRVVRHPCVHVLGHPTGRILGRRPPVAFDADEVFAAAARSGTALEINAYPDRLDLDDDMIRRAAAHGAVFAISTDAHAVGHLDHLPYGVAMAQRAWLGPDRVINAWPWERLRAFLAGSGDTPAPGRAGPMGSEDPGAPRRGRAG
jgi:DNA polymerase (family 10)